MKSTIHIPEPCPAEWNQMKPCDNGRFCGSCQKVVVDFSNKTLDEIHDYFNAHKTEHVCGLYKERHTSKGNLFYSFLNRVEAMFCKFKMQKVALFFIAVALFITGCRTRRTQGLYSSTSRFLTQDSTFVADTAHIRHQDTTQAKPN
jgi:hypothetical protein